MKYLIAAFMFGCSSDNVGTTKQSDQGDCKTIASMPDITTCTNLVLWKCKGGSEGIDHVPALASNYIGTECLREDTNTYYYVCGINDKNEVWVYCNFPGD
jgi:hypothetical protein